MADRCRSVQQWALNITTKLSNDPTRPAFKEFVQVHGFLFLEEFLEDALRGPKDQTVVDLAKTPGRRKDVPKTTRAAAVAMAASQKKIKALHFSMEDNKENQPQPSTTAIANQNFQRASPVKGQNRKEKGIDVDGGHYSGEDSSKRPFQPKVAFTSGESLTQKITMAPINHASRSTTPGHTTAKYLPTAPLPEYVHEESSESLKHVAEGSEGPEEPISTNNEFMYQELSVIEEDDDMDLTMIQPPSQSLERTLIQTDVPTVFQSTTAALDAPVVSQNTIVAASTAVPSRHALFIDPITTPEASTSSARPVPIATNTPSSPPKHDPRVQSEAIASGPTPGLASSPSFQSSETSNAVSVVPATSAHVQPVLQLKSTAEQPLQTNPAGPSTASLTHATSVPDLNLDTHDAPAPHQPPQVRSSWLREALLPAVPKQSMGAALIAQAKKSMGVRPSGLGIGMARASGVKRKSDSIDFDDRREERKSKSFKTSHYGGGMKTSEALVPVVTAKTTAATSNEKPVPFKEDESEMSDFEVEVGGQDDDEDKTTFSKLAETIRDENNKRLARSIVHQQGDTVKDAPLKKIAHYPIDIDLTGRFNIPIPSPSETTPVSTPVAAAVVNPTEAISDINTTTSSQPHMSAVPALPVAQQKRSLPHERLSISELVNSSQSNGRMKPKQNAKVQEGGVTGGAKPFTLLVDSIASTTTPENSPPKANSSIISTFHQIQTATTTTVAIVQAQVPEGAAADPPLFLGRDKVVTPVVPKDSRDAPYKDLSLFEEMVFGIGGKKAQHTPVSGSVQPPTNPAAPINVPAREATNPSTLSRAPLVPVDKTLTSNVYPFETLPPARGPTLANAQQDPLSRQATFASQTSTQSSFADSIFATSQPMARTHAYNPEMDPFSQTSTQPTEYMESQEDSIPQSKGKGRQVVPPAETPVAKHPVPPTVGLRGHNIFSNDGDENEVDRGVNADRSGSDTEEEPQEADITTSTSMIGTGLFGSAANFVAKAFGGSAKKPPQVDQLKALNAAVAAKKEQEEKERKKARTMELMEQRRIAAAQKKAEEEKARQAALEKKKKEESEKRKRDRDEMNVSKIGNKGKRQEEEPSKKRKVTVEMDKRSDLKKTLSKDKLNASYQASTVAGSALNANRVAPPRPQSQQAQYASSLQPVKTIVKKPSGFFTSSSQPTHNSALAPSGPSFSKLPPSFQRPSASTKLAAAGPSGAAPAAPAATAQPTQKTLDRPAAKASTQDKQQPSQTLRQDMQARVQAQLTTKSRDAALASEQIELPEINSEYEDSDDEERNMTMLPDWVQSPALRQQLIDQSTIDPEEYFGAIPELKMEEIFKQTRVSKFRGRTSSANWNGADKLTVTEREEYAKSMGYFK